ncbi:hypothetical protein CK203_056510 [Vitis vinifera]|uniref:Uncharacterized protein n=1 Tax=Vitis vinifera TaxID=29760 RepID=A0A438GEJ1_VITVI|nr:hypothetical protein CK203_056510 [Vitis vinifera]
MKGGRAWFGVDSKSFGISVGFFKGKVSGAITERGWRFSTWIRFGERGLSLLLQGVEFGIQKGTGKFLAILGSKEREASNFSYVVMKREDFACAQFLLQKREGEAPHSKSAEYMGDKVPASYAEVTTGPRKASFSSWWKEFQVEGWECHRFMKRLQYVKSKLKRMDKVVFEQLKERKKNTIRDVINIDASEQEGDLSPKLLALKASRKGEMEELLLSKEVH